MSSTEKKFKYTRSATLPEITFHYLYDHEYPDLDIYNNQSLLIIYDAPDTDGPIIRQSLFKDNLFYDCDGDSILYQECVEAWGPFANEYQIMLGKLFRGK